MIVGAIIFNAYLRINHIFERSIQLYGLSEIMSRTTYSDLKSVNKKIFKSASRQIINRYILSLVVCIVERSKIMEKFSTRKGCKDIWNAYMAKGAIFSKNDIPFCPTTAKEPPKSIITWEEAITVYRKQISVGNKDFKNESFVCFYIDDYKFDGSKGIWNNPEKALRILSHFAGAITPDFSTYQDFPEPIKIYSIYRMRLFGYWLGKNGIAIINNVRWGTSETYLYCYDGIPKRSFVAIGTVAGNPRKLANRKRFQDGIFKMIDELEPHTIIVYGSANDKCFKKIKAHGIKVIDYPSKTSQAFERRKIHE